jgi:thioredoxin-related protein
MLKFILIMAVFLNSCIADDKTTTGQFLGSKKIEKMPDWFKTSFLDFAEDTQESAENNKHLILYFHQDGCPYCAKLVEENFTDKKLVTKIRKDFDIIDINMWGDRDLTDLKGLEFTEKQYAEFLKVQFTPSLFFLDFKGNIVLRMDGYQSINKMHKILDFVKDKNYKNQSFAEFSSVKKIGKLNNQGFFSKPPYIITRSKNHPANKYLAVFFEEPSCEACDDFHEKMLVKPKIKNAFKQMEVVQLNINLEQKIINTKGEKTTSKNWYKKLNLVSTPAVVIFDKNGDEIIRKDASFKEFHFDSILQYALSESYKNQPNFQRYIEHRADDIRATGKDVDLWKD